MAHGEDPGQDIVVYMEYINNVNYNWGSQMATYGGMDESQIRNIMDGHVIL